jgi:hypothetical protein
MRLKVLFSAIGLILAMILSGLCWAQCPEEPNDLGECDTLHVVPWSETDTCYVVNFPTPDTICINEPGENFPCFLFVHLLVTHDANPLPDDPTTEDSISAFVIPLTFWHQSTGGADSLIFPFGNPVNPNAWNNSIISPYTPMDKSMFRHFVDPHNTSDTTYNRMLQMVEAGQAAWNVFTDVDSLASDGDSGHVFLGLTILDPNSQRWWEGDTTLLATLTFKVSDTMHVGIDSAFWPPASNFTFTRYDAVIYFPRHHLPLTIWVGPPRIVVTSPNGGESWMVGETYDITWISENFTGADVKLEFSADGGYSWMTIIGSTPNDGAYLWTIPDTTSDSCRVRVSDAEDGDPYDISDSNFSITYQPDFTIDAIPDTQWVKQGDSASFEVILTDLYGFTSACTLTVTGLPELATGEFDPAVIIPTDTSTLTIGTDSLTPLGAYPLTITATEMAKQVEHSIQRWLVVVSALNFKPHISVPESVTVYAGFTANFTAVATDADTSDTLTITKEGVGEFPCPPRTTPNVCYFWWTTEDADTLNSPYQVVFAVDDGRDSTDTGIVGINVLPYNIPPSGTEGDANGDGVVDIGDVVFLLNYLFSWGPPPNPPSAGDVNGDCFVGISDIIWLINYIYFHGPGPQIRCLPGDVNYDGNVNLLDIYYFIDYALFNGPPPVSMRSTDVNADCFINVVDLVYEINYLLRGGPPCQPGCVEPKAGPEMAPVTAIAEVGFLDLRYDQKSRIMELPVNANFDVPVAGVALSVTWDPEELSFLEPTLTSRTEGLGLYYNLKPGELIIGMLDIHGAKVITPGTGSIVTLRFIPEDRKKVDLKSIQIEKATFVNTQAQELLLRMAK